jgi:hypothetical protein
MPKDGIGFLGRKTTPKICAVQFVVNSWKRIVIATKRIKNEIRRWRYYLYLYLLLIDYVDFGSL